MAPLRNTGKTRLHAGWGLLFVAGLALLALAGLLPGMGAKEMLAGGDEFVLLPAGDAAPGHKRPTAAPTEGNAEVGRRFAQSLVIVPRVAGVADAGFVISRHSEPAMLAEHTLRVGDVLLTIDGRPLDSARIQNLGNELSAFDAVEVRYERAGQIRSRLLTFD